MQAPDVLLGALEVALNRYLALDGEVLAQCAQLSGRSLALQVDAPDWVFLIEFHEGGVRVLPPGTLEPEVSVRGSLATLMRLAWTVAQGQAGVPQGLSIEGDAELLQQFNRMLSQVGFDPEEFAARFLGDAAAHRLNQGLQALFGWGRRGAENLAADTAEFLREQTQDLARASEVEQWMNEVDDLRDGVERLDARLKQLEAGAP